MARKRMQYATRTVWYLVIALSIVVVVGFAAGAYEVNHLRTEFNGLHRQVQSLNSEVSNLYATLLKLTQRLP